MAASQGATEQAARTYALALTKQQECARARAALPATATAEEREEAMQRLEEATNRVEGVRKTASDLGVPLDVLSGVESEVRGDS